MCIFKYKAVLSYMKTVNNDFSCFQRLCRMETLVLSVQSFKSALEWKGETITVGCSFTLSGSRKLFCKEKCEKGNILIETTDDSAQSGRYSIKYVEGFFLIHTVVYVSITELEKSDSGRYRCSLDRTPSDHLSLNWDFEVVVTEGEFLQKVTKTFMSLRIICVFSLSQIENNCVVRILVNFLWLQTALSSKCCSDCFFVLSFNFQD